MAPSSHAAPAAAANAGGDCLPSRGVLYHAAVVGMQQAFTRAGVNEDAKDALVLGMLQILPLNASDEAFDEWHAKVRATADDTLSIPFEAALRAVGKDNSMDRARVEAIGLYAHQLWTDVLPGAHPSNDRDHDRFVRRVRTPLVGREVRVFQDSVCVVNDGCDAMQH